LGRRQSKGPVSSVLAYFDIEIEHPLGLPLPQLTGILEVDPIYYLGGVVQLQVLSHGKAGEAIQPQKRIKEIIEKGGGRTSKLSLGNEF